MERAVHHVELLLAGQPDEVHGVAGNPDRELRILLRMIHRVEQHLAMQHVHIQMVPALGEITVEQRNQILTLLFRSFPERTRHDRKRVADSVLGVVVGKFRNRLQRGDRTIHIAPVHRIRARRERFARLAAVRGRSGFLAVHHVARDGQDRHGRLRVPVGLVARELPLERFDDFHCDRINPVVVVAELREIPLGDELADQTGLVHDRFHFRVFDRRQAVGQHREPRNAAGHGADDLLVVQRHFDPLVAVFVVHVVDDVQRVDVEFAEPVGDLVEVPHYLVVVQIAVAGQQRNRRSDLHVVVFHVAAAVDRVEQRLREVAARAEELHLLADPHRGDAAGDTVVIAEFHAHQVVVLILDRRGQNGDFGAEFLEVFRQLDAPQHGQVRLRRGAEVDQRVQEAVAHFSDHVAAVQRHAAERFGDPGGIAAEQLVVGRGAQETHDPQLHDEVVHELLNLLFGVLAAPEVGFGVDVEEGRDAADRHRRAVLLLDRREIAEIEPLDRLFGVFRRAGDVEAVFGGHRLEFLERLDLFGDLLALADVVGIHHVDDHLLLGALLFGDQPVHAVERHPAVVADDAAAAVGVRQAGHDAGVAGRFHLVGVDVEHAVVVGLAVFEHICDLRIHLPAVGVQLGVDQPDAAEGHDRAFQRGVGLEPDDLLKLPVDIARLMRVDGRNRLFVDIVDALAFPLDLHQGAELLPQGPGPVRSGSQK